MGCELPRKLYGPSLPDDRHLDLTWIFEVLFYLESDVAGQFLGFDVADGFGFDEDADLAAGLEGVGLFYSRE